MFADQGAEKPLVVAVPGAEALVVAIQGAEALVVAIQGADGLSLCPGCRSSW